MQLGLKCVWATSLVLNAKDGFTEQLPCADMSSHQAISDRFKSSASKRRSVRIWWLLDACSVLRKQRLALRANAANRRMSLFARPAICLPISSNKGPFVFSHAVANTPTGKNLQRQNRRRPTGKI
jgi:hypothetical protein